MKEKHSYCFVAGQSGGHIVPCITLAKNLIVKHPNATILFFTTRATLDKELTQSLGASFTVIQLPIASIKRHNPYQLMYFCVTFFISLITSFYYLITFRPQSITSSGGITTIPVALAAYCMRIPIDLYELNVLPGRTTYFLAHIARTIYCCFTRTFNFLPKNRCKKTGYPIRFFNEEQHSRTTSHTIIGLSNQKKTILVLGGSQGSFFINNIIKQWVMHSKNIDFIQIIHQTGAADSADWQAFYAQHGITAITFSFHKDMEPYYAASDLVICRSGAGTLFEVLYFNTPCITIPLELQSNAHQVHNAFTIAQEYQDLFQVLSQDMLMSNPHLLDDSIAQALQLPPYTVDSAKTYAPEPESGNDAYVSQ